MWCCCIQASLSNWNACAHGRTSGFSPRRRFTLESRESACSPAHGLCCQTLQMTASPGQAEARQRELGVGQPLQRLGVRTGHVAADAALKPQPLGASYKKQRHTHRRPALDTGIWPSLRAVPEPWVDCEEEVSSVGSSWLDIEGAAEESEGEDHAILVSAPAVGGLAQGATCLCSWASRVGASAGQGNPEVRLWALGAAMPPICRRGPITRLRTAALVPAQAPRPPVPCRAWGPSGGQQARQHQDAGCDRQE
uniref:Uncharacterized protein n=1 Tax=Pyrodinium bahamense TaxID=73915 RepID=A0A7S0FL85_9DINO